MKSDGTKVGHGEIPSALRGCDTPLVVTIVLTKDIVKSGGRILSRMQGSEDPLGQQEYYEDLFKNLMKDLVEEGAAIPAS